MNQAQNTNANNTFSSQPASQSNPFTADLKGEFTSNFGTNTNAVSQIFKEGGFAGQERTKYYILGAVLVLLAAAVYFLYFSDTKDEFATEEEAADTTAEETAETTDETAAAPTDAQEGAPATDATASAPTTATAPAPQEAVVGGPISLISPASGASLTYDETQGPAKFSWDGGPGTIIFSRNSQMSPETMRVKVSSNTYSFNHPYPGTWYWKVEGSAGASEVRSFSVSAPIRRNVSLTAPSAGGALAGTGGSVTWQGDSGVAYYRVELSTGDWANPPYKFSSSGSAVQLQGVTAGTYQMRLGAFSEVAGRWEYTQPISVTVQ